MKRKLSSRALAVVLALILAIMPACDKNNDKGKQLASVSMHTIPAKVKYRAGQTVDPAGGKITAKFSDGAEDVIDITASMLKLDGVDMNTLGNKAVTVSWTADKITKTTSYQIEVTKYGDATLTGIAISTAPDKLLYKTGQTIDPSGGKITASFSDGENEEVPITADMLVTDGVNMNTAGSKTVTVSYSAEGIAETASYLIEVTPYGDLPTLKADSLDMIDAAFASYEETDYREEQWTELLAAYNGGKAAVNAASTQNAVLAARQNALNDMDAALPLGAWWTQYITELKYGKTYALDYLAYKEEYTAANWTTVQNTIAQAQEDIGAVTVSGTAYAAAAAEINDIYDIAAGNVDGVLKTSKLLAPWKYLSSFGAWSVAMSSNVPNTLGQGYSAVLGEGEGETFLQTSFMLSNGGFNSGEIFGGNATLTFWLYIGDIAALGTQTGFYITFSGSAEPGDEIGEYGLCDTAALGEYIAAGNGYVTGWNKVSVGLNGFDITDAGIFTQISFGLKTMGTTDGETTVWVTDIRFGYTAPQTEPVSVLMTKPLTMIDDFDYPDETDFLRNWTAQTGVTYAVVPGENGANAVQFNGSSSAPSWGDGLTHVFPARLTDWSNYYFVRITFKVGGIGDTFLMSIRDYAQTQMSINLTGDGTWQTATYAMAGRMESGFKKENMNRVYLLVPAGKSVTVGRFEVLESGVESIPAVPPLTGDTVLYDFSDATDTAGWTGTSGACALTDGENGGESALLVTAASGSPSYGGGVLATISALFGNWSNISYVRVRYKLSENGGTFGLTFVDNGGTKQLNIVLTGSDRWQTAVFATSRAAEGFNMTSVNKVYFRALADKSVTVAKVELLTAGSEFFPQADVEDRVLFDFASMTSLTGWTGGAIEADAVSSGVNALRVSGTGAYAAPPTTNWSDYNYISVRYKTQDAGDNLCIMLYGNVKWFPAGVGGDGSWQTATFAFSRFAGFNKSNSAYVRFTQDTGKYVDIAKIWLSADGPESIPAPYPTVLFDFASMTSLTGWTGGAIEADAVSSGVNALRVSGTGAYAAPPTTNWGAHNYISVRYKTQDAGDNLCIMLYGGGVWLGFYVVGDGTWQTATIAFSRFAGFDKLNSAYVRFTQASGKYVDVAKIWLSADGPESAAEPAATLFDFASMTSLTGWTGGAIQTDAVSPGVNALRVSGTGAYANNATAGVITNWSAYNYIIVRYKTQDAGDKLQLMLYGSSIWIPADANGDGTWQTAIFALSSFSGFNKSNSAYVRFTVDTGKYVDIAKIELCSNLPPA